MNQHTLKYSILVTLFDPERKLTDMTLACLESILINSEGEDYELIIDYGLKGLFTAYNDLFRKARGECFLFCFLVRNL